MRSIRLSPCLSLIGLACHFTATCAHAQGRAQAEIVVPTTGVFAAGTTVSVPDRGGVSPGGFRSASTVRNEFGPALGRGTQSRHAASDAGVRVWIHDFDEMERSLVGRSDGEADAPRSGFAARLRDYASSDRDARTVDDRQATSPDPCRERALAREEHAAELLKRGEAAEARGALKLASLYYKAVVRLRQPSSEAIATSRLRYIEDSP